MTCGHDGHMAMLLVAAKIFRPEIGMNFGVREKSFFSPMKK